MDGKLDNKLQSHEQKMLTVSNIITVELNQ